MRFPVLLLIAGSVLPPALPQVDAEPGVTFPDMRSRVLAILRERVPTFTRSAGTSGDVDDPSVLKLPPFLVNAPSLKTPSADETKKVTLQPVGFPNYAKLVRADQDRQRQLHDLLDLADMAGMSGDDAVSRKLRREAYRALTRDPTPLERAMDRSANGGRY